VGKCRPAEAEFDVVEGEGESGGGRGTWAGERTSVPFWRGEDRVFKGKEGGAFSFYDGSEGGARWGTALRKTPDEILRKTKITLEWSKRGFYITEGGGVEWQKERIVYVRIIIRKGDQSLYRRKKLYYNSSRPSKEGEKNLEKPRHKHQLKRGDLTSFSL